MDGLVTDDEYYRSGRHVEFVDNPTHPETVMPSMTRDQLLAYHLSTVATVYQWKGRYPIMVDTFNRALKLDPDQRDSLNNLAWYYAAVPETKLRDGAKAVVLALRAVEQEPSGNFYDTLACAYAQNGQFDLAAKFELTAAHTPALFFANPQEHLSDFAAGRPCTDRQFRADVMNFHDSATPPPRGTL
jgi:tetratricopeptide (TPR) repeat protein